LRVASAAVGFSVHTGWAAAVVVAGTPRAPRILARERVALVDRPERFVFHAAVELDPARAERLIEGAAAEAKANATEALRRFRGEHGVGACAVVASAAPAPDELAAILRSHMLIHAAEGRLYRDAILAGAKQARVAAKFFPAKVLDEVAAAALGADAALVAAAGKGAGPPWGKDQRMAALAAWVVLAVTPG
jgi:hypothetical protein